MILLSSIAYSKFLFSQPRKLAREQPDVCSKSFINLSPPPQIKPIWLAKFVINTVLSGQENYTHELEIHKKRTCEQRVGILTFCQYYMVTCTFQAFIVFSQPTGALVELLCFNQFEASTSSPRGPQGLPNRGGLGGVRVPNYFSNYKELV